MCALSAEEADGLLMSKTECYLQKSAIAVRAI